MNQADSLAVEAGADAARRDVACPPDRADVVARQHVLGHGERRSGRAADHPPHPPRESRRADRRDRLLRVALRATRSRRCPAWPRSCRNDDKPRLLRRCCRRVDARARGADGPCGRTPGPGLMGRTALDAARADRLRRAVQLLHHPDDARREPEPDARRRARRTARASCDAGYKEVALTGVHLGAWGRDLSPARARWPICSRGAGRRAAATSACASARSSRWTARPRSSTLVDRARPLRAAPAPAAAARLATAMLRGDASSVFGRRIIAALVDDVRRAAAARGDRLGRDRRVSRARPTRTSTMLAGYLESSPLTHLHVFPYSDRPGTAADGAARQGARRRWSKARAQRLRAISRVLSDAVPRRAGRHVAAGADHRRRHDGRDRQLLQGAGAGRAQPQRVGGGRRFPPAGRSTPGELTATQGAAGSRVPSAHRRCAPGRSRPRALPALRRR